MAVTLTIYGLLCGIGIPLASRRWARTDRAERARIAEVLRRLAAEMGGEFVVPREVPVVDDDGHDYGRRPDYGTALVSSLGLVVEVGVQVGAPAAKCLRVRVLLPPGRAWSVQRLRARRLGPWLTRVPAPSTFRLAYRGAGTEHLGGEARTTLLALRADAVDLWLQPDALVVWVLRASSRSDARVDGVTDAARLVPYIGLTAEVARLLLADV
jgi:hypothetical protein